MVTNWIRRFRDKVNLSQEELVARLQLSGVDISRSTLSNWETSKSNPPLDDPRFRESLAAIFRVSIPDLLLAAGYEIDVRWSEPARRAAWIIDQLPNADQDFALGMLERLLEKAQLEA